MATLGSLSTWFIWNYTVRRNVITLSEEGGKPKETKIEDLTKQNQI